MCGNGACRTFKWLSCGLTEADWMSIGIYGGGGGYEVVNGGGWKRRKRAFLWTRSCSASVSVDDPAKE